MPQKSQNIFSGLPLWEHFEDNATSVQVALVEKHVEIVMPLLDYYIKTFPTYTIHNGQHQKNIVSIIGSLLGQDVKKLTTLEAAILILSAVYHDVGMVFSETELAQVASEDRFTQFLEETPSAKLRFYAEGQVADRELIEWYCRAVHAERVWKYLDIYDIQYPLVWDRMPFKNELAYVCESHNWPASALKSDERLRTDFLGKCDLLFCSILLRMADILDFDSTRSPQSVYEYLGLNNPKNNIEAVSKTEWQKHLMSGGFNFTHPKNDLALSFTAAPTHPEIEMGIRKFVNIIKLEMASCKTLLRFCSEQWRDLYLPGDINTDNINSQNYTSGRYHFSLSENKVLDLLTGEGLYKDEYIFIRELLQNAIDTSRHREFTEQTKNNSFKPQPIIVSFFLDKEGYNWVRIDDHGMGMNRDIITDHLLKKGESYYTSDKFKLEQLSIQKTTHHEFVPISRFGIGLLSCFMASDRIEISTKHVNEPGVAHRLSLQGRDGYFILQSSDIPHIPSPMPAEHNFQPGYRQEAGTSIAIRINNSKEFAGFDFKAQIEDFVLCSPVPIHYNGDNIGGEWDAILLQPWTADHFVAVEEAFIKEVEDTFNVKLPKGIRIQVRNINIADHAQDNDIKGQIIFIAIDLGQLRPPHTLPEFELTTQTTSIILRATKKIKRDDKEQDVTLEYKNETLLKSLNIPDKIVRRRFYRETEFAFSGFMLSHNGIIIHDEGRFFNLNDIEQTQPFRNRNRANLYCGILYFQDKLLPSLTVSRNEIRTVPFIVYINTLIALRPLNEFIPYVNLKYDFFDNRSRNNDYSRNAIRSTQVYEKNKEYWDNEPLYYFESGLLSINDIRGEIAKRQLEFRSDIFYNNRIFNNFSLYILEENFAIKIQIEKLEKFLGFKFTLNITKKEIELPEVLGRFRPFVFFTFEGITSKLAVGHFINIEHPFIQWYIKCSGYLYEEFTYYSWQLIYLLQDGSDVDKINAINDILERLRHVMPGALSPGKNINIKEEDF